ncbi:MAG: hypothetical protein ACREJC_01620 [Tepidisphaeraceae bacterium]
MAGKLLCPDCGGVLGEPEAGEAQCTCFSGSSSKSDTAHLEVPETVEKVCHVCGTDVSGKKRYRDSRGYICRDCAKKEREQETVGTVACGECGRRVRPEGLRDYSGVKICKKCFDEHKEVSQKKWKRKVTTYRYDLYEKRNLLILAGILGVLALIILWSMLFSK